MPRQKRQWTPEEDAAIRSYPAKGIARLALELKTSADCIKRRLVEFGLQIRKPGRPGSLPPRKEADFGSDIYPVETTHST